MDRNNRLVKLPKKGRLLIFTDIHGNLQDYEKFLKIWDSNDSDCYIVIAGDFIHSIYKKDYSIEILEDIIEKYKKYDNFIPLLGNHEWSHIVGANVFRGTINLKYDFEQMIIDKKSSLEPYLSNYVEFFKSIPFFVQTENGIFISHAGPSKRISSINDFNSVVEGEEFLNEDIHSVLWSRPKHDYDENTVSDFLNLVGSNVMVVGHTMVDGCETFGNQLILASSFSSGDKAYLDVDLSKDINGMDGLIEYIKFLD